MSGSFLDDFYNFFRAARYWKLSADRGTAVWNGRRGKQLLGFGLGMGGTLCTYCKLSFRMRIIRGMLCGRAGLRSGHLFLLCIKRIGRSHACEYGCSRSASFGRSFYLDSEDLMGVPQNLFWHTLYCGIAVTITALLFVGG